MVAASLIVVPLLVAAAIAIWPTEAANVSSVVILPPKTYGRETTGINLEMIRTVLTDHLKEITDLEIKSSPSQSADAAVLTTLTSDSGILQLNIEVFDTRTRKRIWGNAYHSPTTKYSDMLRVAGEGIRRALE